MSKYRYEMGGIIRDTEIDFPYYSDEIIELLDEKDQRIAELEEQLKNARKETAQVRKEVGEEIRKKLEEKLDYDWYDKVEISTICHKINSVLDQIQG